MLEKAAKIRLYEPIDANNKMVNFQSAYSSGHSAETALLRVLHELLTSADWNIGFLVLLVLSAAFDTVDQTREDPG